jgi:hypothetical protein
MGTIGEAVSIFADGRLHRQTLDRITNLRLASFSGNLYLRLKITGGVLDDWLTGEVVFRFVVNNGEQTLTGTSPGVTRFTNEKGVHYARIEFRDPETGREKLLGEWKTLEIVLVAGKEEKSFTASKEDNATPEVKETS